METNAITQMVATLMSPATVREQIVQNILANCQCPRTVYLKGKAA